MANRAPTRSLCSLRGAVLARRALARTGIETSAAEGLTRILKSPITAYIEAAAARELDTEEEAAFLNDILRALLRWQASRS